MNDELFFIGILIWYSYKKWSSLPVDIISNLAVFIPFTGSTEAALSQYGRYWIIHNIACELFPKGNVANDKCGS